MSISRWGVRLKTSGGLRSVAVSVGFVTGQRRLPVSDVHSLVGAGLLLNWHSTGSWYRSKKMNRLPTFLETIDTDCHTVTYMLSKPLL